MLRNKKGELIATIDDWSRPKSTGQWQAGRSAMELARAWTGVAGRCSPPADLDALLRAHPAFTDAGIVSGTPEDLVTFDDFSGPRNADLNLICESPLGPIIISIEAKADESYGGTVGAQLRAAKRRIDAGERSNAAARAEALVRRFAPHARDPHRLPYQLLTASAATLRFAEQQNAVAALLLIHEFINGKRHSGAAATSPAKIKANAAALNRFISELSGGTTTALVAPAIVGPFAIDGYTPSFYIGKLQTDLESQAAR
jgi:hypothetical protein